MSKPILFAITLVVFFSCESAEEKKAKEHSELRHKVSAVVKNYILQTMNEADNGDVLDTIDIYQIDTLTAKLDSIRNRNYLFSMLDQELEALRRQREIAQLNMDQAKLTRGLDRDLHEMAARDAKDELNKTNEMLDDVNMLRDKLVILDSLIKYGNIDSVAQIGYIAKFNVKGRDKKGIAQNLDSLEMPLDMSLRILLKQ